MTEWETKKLGDLAEVLRGSTITRKEVSPGEVPVIAGGQTPSCYHNVSNRDGKTITVSASGAYAGFVQYFEIPIFASDCSTIKVKDENQTSSKFLFYMLQASQSEIYAFQRGSGQPHVYPSQLVGLDIPIPPIEEQNKVVELLENHFARLDAALADVKQVKVKAAQFRRSFVHEMTTAVEGSEVMRVLDICDVYQPKTISTKELIADGEFPVYGANGQIGFYDKFNHEDSEVTVTCRGATCGTVNVIPAMSWITGNAMVFRPKDSRIQKGFLEYVLRGMEWTSVITGTAQPQITRTSIEDVFVNVPSPDVQSEIYMKLESSMTQVTSAALLSEKVEIQASSLRRSLLQAAFTGQLTKEVANV
jgi:restriction endonuclease S subunit